MPLYGIMGTGIVRQYAHAHILRMVACCLHMSAGAGRGTFPTGGTCLCDRQPMLLHWHSHAGGGVLRTFSLGPDGVQLGSQEADYGATLGL